MWSRVPWGVQDERGVGVWERKPNSSQKSTKCVYIKVKAKDDGWSFLASCAGVCHSPALVTLAKWRWVGVVDE